MSYPPHDRFEDKVHSFKEKGDIYERFVGACFEECYQCTVIYVGLLFDMWDGGIDLIAINKDTTYLIQCKNYNIRGYVHQNTLNQLAGSANVFRSKHPTALNVTPVLAYTCSLDEDAMLSAKVNKITLLPIEYHYRHTYVYNHFRGKTIRIDLSDTLIKNKDFAHNLDEKLDALLSECQNISQSSNDISSDNSSNDIQYIERYLDFTPSETTTKKQTPFYQSGCFIWLVFYGTLFVISIISVLLKS